MGDYAWSFLESIADTHQYIGVAETHVPESQLRKWDARARGAGLRLSANAARPSGRHQSINAIDKANEGGEWLLFLGHLQ
eukprot:2037600-Pyramimonas_sp.AAC.1